MSGRVFLSFVFSAAVVLLSAAPVSASQKIAADLSPEERAYVEKTKTVTLCVDPDWEPFEKIDSEGRYVGIGADLVRTVFERTGLELEVYKTADWDESVAAAKTGKCKGMAFLNQTKEREEWLSFTDPVFFDPNVVITREGHPFIPDLSQIQYESVAIPHNTSIEEWLRTEYPNLLVIPTKSEKEAIDLVSERKADMTVRSLIIAAYTIKKEGLFNLKVAGQFSGHENRLRIGVTKDEPMLREVLQKWVATLTETDRSAASNAHVPITVQRGTDTDLIIKILTIAALVLVAGLYWNRKLSALNRELERLSSTDRLTGLCNRMKLDEKFEEEILRFGRFKNPFSVIMVDVDHFKSVNDAHGHQTGDAVLVQTANVLLENTRKTDVVGRWGGEEFLILCPGTDAEGAAKVAENLRKAIEGSDFGKVGTKTASFGIAECVEGELAKDVVAKADAALYRAKNAGRNRVEKG